MQLQLFSHATATILTCNCNYSYKQLQLFLQATATILTSNCNYSYMQLQLFSHATATILTCNRRTILTGMMHFMELKLLMHSIKLELFFHIQIQDLATSFQSNLKIK
jgi:hypothetical protein